jgi:hypothetical protein
VNPIQEPLSQRGQGDLNPSIKWDQLISRIYFKKNISKKRLRNQLGSILFHELIKVIRDKNILKMFDMYYFYK